MVPVDLPTWRKSRFAPYGLVRWSRVSICKPLTCRITCDERRTRPIVGFVVSEVARRNTHERGCEMSFLDQLSFVGSSPMRDNSRPWPLQPSPHNPLLTPQQRVTSLVRGTVVLPRYLPTCISFLSTFEDSAHETTFVSPPFRPSPAPSCRAPLRASLPSTTVSDGSRTPSVASQSRCEQSCVLGPPGSRWGDVRASSRTA